MRALFAGSFSPPTCGHLDVIRRASEMFDEVVVAVLSQKEKRYDFSEDERREMVETITASLKGVRVVSYDGLLVDLAAREGADVVLRGVRGPEDLTLELQLAEVYRRLSGIETLLMPCRPETSLISSTIVRDCASHGASIRGMVPEEIIEKVYSAFGRGPEVERKG